MVTTPTTVLEWRGDGTSGKPMPFRYSGLGAAYFSAAVSTAGAHQLGLLVDTSGVAGKSTIVRLAWVGADSLGAPVPTTDSFLESVEIPVGEVSTVNNGTAYRYRMSPKEWEIAPAARVAIWNPVGAPYFVVGAYSPSETQSSDLVRIYLQLTHREACP